MSQICTESSPNNEDGVVVASSDLQLFLNLLHNFETKESTSSIDEDKLEEKTSFDTTSNSLTTEENTLTDNTIDILKSLIYTNSTADLYVLNSLFQSITNRNLSIPTVPETKWNNEDTSEGFVFHPDGSLNLDVFRVHLCKNESNVHDRKNCSFHHTSRDRRRLPALYKAEQCDDSFDVDDDSLSRCPQGDRCTKCHNRHELLYHPDIYKQRFCSSYIKGFERTTKCHRGRFCAFAHSRDEIRCQLFSEEAEATPDYKFFMMNFKSLWCPYGTQHDWHGCLYAHTYQDCRRSPLIGYGSEPCPYWQKDLHSADYQRRCPLGALCPYSHGSKEQLYHPAYYKTMPCTDFKANKICPRGNLCAFYHELEEKRSASGLDKDNTTISGNIKNSDVTGALVYDYTKPITSEHIKFLQDKFMIPPLFNLDDFEAFGHDSRTENHKRLDSRSQWFGGIGPESPVKSKIRNRNFMQFRANSFTDCFQKQSNSTSFRHGNYSDHNLRLENSLELGSDLGATTHNYPLSPSSHKAGQRLVPQISQF